MPDDPELLRRYAECAPEEAFAELVRRHIATVYAAALRRVGGDAHLAQEVTQEVFTDLARKAGSLAQRGLLVGWLFVAARFAASKAVRRDRQRQILWRKALEMTEREQTEAGEPDWESLRPDLDAAVDSLKAPEREAILLYHFEQQTFSEVGRALAVTENGARLRVERALEKLRQTLGRRGITSTAAALATALGSQAMAAVPASLAATVACSASAASLPVSGVAALLLMAITKTQLSVALALVLASAAYLGVTQHQQIASLQAQNKALAATSASDAKRAQALAGRLEAATQALARARAPSSSGSSKDDANTMKVIHTSDILRAHPEWAALERKAMRHSTVQSYERAIEALKLSPDGAAQVKELLVAREFASFDTRQAADAADVGRDSPELGKAIAQAEAPANQALDALIGADDRGKLEALKGTTFSSFNDIDDLAVDLADAGLGLSPDQAQTLAQVQHDLQDSTKNPGATVPGYQEVDHESWESPLDQDFFTKAAALLTPDQLQVVKTSRTEENQRQAILKEFAGNGPSMITD